MIFGKKLPVSLRNGTRLAQFNLKDISDPLHAIEMKNGISKPPEFSVLFDHGAHTKRRFEERQKACIVNRIKEQP